MQLDLMDLITPYPRRAGYKVMGASKLAADRITDSGAKETIEQKIIGLFRRSGQSWTPDEAAFALKIKTKGARPRFSELCLDKYDEAGRLIRPAFLRKTDDMIEGASEDGMAQHVYTMLDESWREI